MHTEETTAAAAADLPICIISEILSRLRVDDVARCKCVCKSWCTLAKEPHFTYLHLTRSSQMFQQQRQYVLLCEPDGEVLFEIYIGEGRLHMASNGEKEEVTWKTTNISPTNQRFRGNVEASCNGLLCINTPPFNSQGPDIVYNPLTNDHIFLPESSLHPKEGRGYVCGFGFDPTTKKYKVLKCYRDSDENFTWVDRLSGGIITLGESSWRTLQFPDEFKRHIYHTKPLFFNGAFRWIVGKRHYFEDRGLYESHFDGIVTLEISTEKFEITKFSHSLVLPANFVSPVQLENSLALFCIKTLNPAEETSFDIWQILGADTSGSCLYKHKTFSNIKGFPFLGTFGNGVFLFEATQESDPCCKHLVLYDPGKNEGSVIEMVGAPKYFDAFIFTPSLISPA